MSREIHLWNKSRFTNYADAKENEAIYFYDVSHAVNTDNLKCGLLYEAIFAMQSALHCVASSDTLSFALVIDGHIVDYW